MNIHVTDLFIVGAILGAIVATGVWALRRVKTWIAKEVGGTKQ